MAAKKTQTSTAVRPPAKSPQEREHQLISLATDLAEQQLRDGTASAQVTTHFLKMGSERERIERVRMEYEVELLKARTENLTNAGHLEQLTKEALKAFRQYAGQPEVGDDE